MNDPRLLALTKMRQDLVPSPSVARNEMPADSVTVGEPEQITQFREILNRARAGDTKGTAGYNIKAIEEAVRQYDERVNPQPSLIEQAKGLFR